MYGGLGTQMYLLVHFSMQLVDVVRELTRDKEIGRNNVIP